MQGNGSEAFREKHYAAGELAALWGLSADTIRRLFANEPGVVILSRHNLRKRTYRTLRIPASVADRVHSKLSVVSNDQKL